MINLKDIISALTDQELPQLDIAISSVEIDSRQVQPGSLFIALPGEWVNGHDYVGSAFSQGAILALIDKDLPGELPTLDLRQSFFDFNADQVTIPMCLRVDHSLIALQTIAKYWRDQHPIQTIGITGSVGKTSTKELTAALLAEKFSVLKNPGNRNNEIGLPLTLLELEPHHACAVLEMGFYVPGEIRTLCEIAQPHVGVITNIGTVHAERAGSQEIIAKGKAELIEALPPGPDGVAILNMDDTWIQGMLDQTSAHVFSYGIKENADLMAKTVQSHGLSGISCVLSYQGQDHPIRSPLLGAFSVYTILCASAVALKLGLEWDLITSTLAVSQLDLRMHAFTLNNGTTILDDTYNASPASMIAALDLLSGLSGRRVAVLGDMLELGPYEKSGHETVGLAAVTAADVLILVGPRAKTIAEVAVANGFPSESVYWYLDSIQAAAYISEIVCYGDTVLIKGSNSMHMDRILNVLAEGK